MQPKKIITHAFFYSSLSNCCIVLFLIFEFEIVIILPTIFNTKIIPIIYRILTILTFILILLGGLLP